MNIGLCDKRRTILLVDADAHARAVLRNALEAAGFSVGEAANHREGERTALRVRPDAVLVDLMLDAPFAKAPFARIADGIVYPFDGNNKNYVLSFDSVTLKLQ